jgi:CBS domain-containing protein
MHVRVAEIMTNATVTDSTTVSLASAAGLMWRQQTGSLVILDGDEIVGIVTERDVLRTVAAGKNLDNVVVGDVMSTDVVTTTPDTPVRDAARLMARDWIRHLPVVESGGRLVGIVSQRDITGVFAALIRGADVPEIATDTLVRQRRLARLEPGDLD